MNCTLFRAFLPAALILALVAPAPAQKGEEKDDKKEAEAKLIKAGEFVGEVTHVEPNKGAFRLRVTVVYSEPNQGAMNAVVQARLRLAQARSRDDLLNAQRELARAMSQSMYHTRTTHKDLTIDAGEEMKVRMAQPKPEFDDMGNLKKLTARQIAELKGRDGLFDAEMSDIVNGTRVKVTLLRNRTNPKKGRDDVAVEEEKLYASKVIILGVAPPK